MKPIKAAWINELDILYIYEMKEKEVLVGLNKGHPTTKKLVTGYVQWINDALRLEHKVTYVPLEDFFDVNDFIPGLHA